MAKICPTQPGLPADWNAYFSVANADETGGQGCRTGGKVIAPPFDVMESGRMAVIQDPQGALFSLWQANRQIGATHGGPVSQVSWPELTTPDAVGASTFYQALFGWKTKPDSALDQAEYIEWVNGKTSMGGLMPMRGPMWQGVPPTDIPHVGRFAVVNDPQGAVFSLIQMKAAVAAN